MSFLLKFYQISLILIILGVFVDLAYADRVLIRKSDGVPVEFQSGDAPLGSLEANAIKAGYQKKDIEEKYITAQEYAVLKEEKIVKPKKEEQEEKKQQAVDLIKAKLKITDSDLEALRTALQ